jgi:hypothetical protein
LTTPEAGAIEYLSNKFYLRGSDNLSIENRNAYYIGTKLMISDYSWGGDNRNVWLGGATNSTVTGVNNWEGNYNNAIGVNALRSNTTGSYNNAIGVDALFSNTAGNYNNAIGVSALYYNTTGYYNNAIGAGALYYNTTGYLNNAIGVNALFSNTTGNYNNAIGVNALLDLTEGSNNSAFGYNTGRGITTGSNNTILGNNVTGLSAGLSNNIIIADGSGNRRINVDGNGNVGIGTTEPEQILHTKTSSNVAFLGESSSGSNTAYMYLKNAGSSSTYTVGYGSIGDAALISTAGAERVRIDSTGNVGIGLTSPTAVLHLKAGTATANTAPLKFTSGTLLTTPESGTIEFDGTDFYLTI